MSGDGLSKVLATLPAILWALLAVYVIWLLRDNLRANFGRLLGFEGFGLKVSLGTLAAMSAAVELAAKNPKWAVEVPNSARRRAVERAQEQRKLIEGAEILWVDDRPANNRNEARMLASLGAAITFAATTAEAIHALETAAIEARPFHLILSDIARDLPTPEPKAGLQMLDALLAEKCYLPVVFYVGTVDPKAGVPPLAFGITNRPDKLLHLTLDALARTRASNQAS